MFVLSVAVIVVFVVVVVVAVVVVVSVVTVELAACCAATDGIAGLPLPFKNQYPPPNTIIAITTPRIIFHIYFSISKTPLLD
jgi:hypothetical protein